MRTKLLATVTICSLVTGALTAPSAVADQQSPLTVTIVDRNGVNTCKFSTGNDQSITSGILTLRSQYEKARVSLRNTIRNKFPDLKNDFERADTITGVDAEPKAGSLENPELAAIIAAVNKKMTQAGFSADEVYLAFYHSPEGQKVDNFIKPSQLNLLPELNLQQARDFMTMPVDNPDSIKNRVARYFTSAAHLRDWATSLQRQSSLSLLSSVNASETNSLLTSTKNATQLTHKAIEALSRIAIKTCSTNLTMKNVTDGTTSSELVHAPFKGLSSEETRAKKERGDFWSGSAELSSGENTSSKEQFTDLSSGDSSDDSRRSRKISVLLASMGLLSFFINIIIKATPLAKIGASLFDDFTKKINALAVEKKMEHGAPQHK